MDSVVTTWVMLAALAVGALLPLAYQLTMTMRSVRRLLDGVEPRLHMAIDEVSSAAAAANRSMAALDAATLQRTAQSVAEIGNLAKKASDLTATIELASAVGAAAVPAIAAVFQAWRAPAESETTSKQAA